MLPESGNHLGPMLCLIQPLGKGIMGYGEVRSGEDEGRKLTGSHHLRWRWGWIVGVLKDDGPTHSSRERRGWVGQTMRSPTLSGAGT